MSSVFHGTLLLTAANLAIRGISMLFQIYLSSRIGAAGLGLMQLITSVGALALTVGSSGIRIAAMYLCAEEYGHRRTGGIQTAVSVCLRTGLLLSAAAGAALYCLAPRIAQTWIADMRALPSLRLLALFLPLTCLTSVMTGYFTACGKIRQMVCIELGERILSVILTFRLLSYAGNDLTRACCAVFGGSGITCALSFFVMYGLYRRDCTQFSAPTPRAAMRQRMLHLCLPLAANDYLRSGLSTLENLLIPHGLRKSGSSAERSMAAYGTVHGMVFPIITFPAVILWSLADVLVPELARCRARGDVRRIRHLTDKCLRMGFVFAAAVSGTLLCTATPLSELLYGNREAGTYLQTFAPMIPVLYLDMIVDGMHKGLGEQLACVRYNTLTSFLDVLLIFLLLPRYGISGYIFSFVATHLINFCLSIHRLFLVSGYRIRSTFCLRAGMLAAVSAATVLGLTNLLRAPLPLLALGGAYLALYFLLLTLGDVFSVSDLRWLISLLHRNKAASEG